MSQSQRPKSERPHILIVDDQESVRTALRQGLEDEGFTVSEAADRAALLEHLEKGLAVDLITLDLNLGGSLDEAQTEGLRLAREIRAKRNVPIIMITAHTEPVDRVKGLEQGADDYIVKPFHIREVVVRMRSVLRRYELERDSAAAARGGSERYEAEMGIVDVGRREARGKEGEPILLTDAEFDILVAFLRNPARVLSRDDLTLMLKGRMWSPNDRTLDGHIARLRKKIEPNIADPRYVKTVWRVGYVFAGDVRRL